MKTTSNKFRNLPFIVFVINRYKKALVKNDGILSQCIPVPLIFRSFLVAVLWCAFAQETSERYQGSPLNAEKKTVLTHLALYAFCFFAFLFVCCQIQPEKKRQTQELFRSNL